jgi:hypothetical protein
MATSRKSTIALATTVISLFAAACSDASNGTNSVQMSSAITKQEAKVSISAAQITGASSAQKVPAIQLTHRVRSQTEIFQHGALIAEVLVGKEKGALRSAPHADSMFAAKGSTHFALDGNPHLKVHYLDSHDELGVINEDVTHDYETPSDIGEKEAESRFNGAFENLASRGAFDRNELDSTNIQRTHIMQAEGTNTGVSRPARIKEYEFTVFRKLNGVPVFQSGTTVSVHRSGALARIRVFGARATGGSVSDTSSNAQPVIDQAQVDRQVAADYGNHQISKLGLQYWLPRDRGLSTATQTPPRYLYVVYPQLPAMQNGKHLVGKGSIVAYPATQGDTDARLVWPPSTPSIPGDPK